MNNLWTDLYVVYLQHVSICRIYRYIVSDTLKIDVHYYLSSQLHPVVSRLCNPIEGLFRVKSKVNKRLNIRQHVINHIIKNYRGSVHISFHRARNWCCPDSRVSGTRPDWLQEISSCWWEQLQLLSGAQGTGTDTVPCTVQLASSWLLSAITVYDSFYNMRINLS